MARSTKRYFHSLTSNIISRQRWTVTKIEVWIFWLEHHDMRSAKQSRHTISPSTLGHVVEDTQKNRRWMQGSSSKGVLHGMPAPHLAGPLPPVCRHTTSFKGRRERSWTLLSSPLHSSRCMYVYMYAMHVGNFQKLIRGRQLHSISKRLSSAM